MVLFIRQQVKNIVHIFIFVYKSYLKSSSEFREGIVPRVGLNASMEEDLMLGVGHHSRDWSVSSPTVSSLSGGEMSRRKYKYRVDAVVF